MSGYTQGTTIYGLRSQYYEGICCYGVIITARCDIAQEKVKALHVYPQYHYVIGSVQNYLIEPSMPTWKMTFWDQLSSGLKTMNLILIHC